MSIIKFYVVDKQVITKTTTEDNGQVVTKTVNINTINRNKEPQMELYTKEGYEVKQLRVKGIRIFGDKEIGTELMINIED